MCPACARVEREGGCGRKTHGASRNPFGGGIGGRANVSKPCEWRAWGGGAPTDAHRRRWGRSPAPSIRCAGSPEGGWVHGTLHNLSARQPHRTRLPRSRRSVEPAEVCCPRWRGVGPGELGGWHSATTSQGRQPHGHDKASLGRPLSDRLGWVWTSAVRAVPRAPGSGQSLRCAPTGLFGGEAPALPPRWSRLPKRRSGELARTLSPLPAAGGVVHPISASLGESAMLDPSGRPGPGCKPSSVLWCEALGSQTTVSVSPPASAAGNALQPSPHGSLAKMRQPWSRLDARDRCARSDAGRVRFDGRAAFRATRSGRHGRPSPDRHRRPSPRTAPCSSRPCRAR